MVTTLEELHKVIQLTIQKASPEEKNQLRKAVLKVLRRDAGVSLLEMAVVVGIIMVVAGIGIPTVLYALDTIRQWMALVSGMVIK